jgi:hypothetical protein
MRTRQGRATRGGEQALMRSRCQWAGLARGRPADQAGTARGCQKNWGPADKSLARQPDAASADSEVRPGPRFPTLRPHQLKTGEAGPEALPTSSLPIRNSYSWIGIPGSWCTEQLVLARDECFLSQTIFLPPANTPPRGGPSVRLASIRTAPRQVRPSPDHSRQGWRQAGQRGPSPVWPSISSLAMSR